MSAAGGVASIRRRQQEGSKEERAEGSKEERAKVLEGAIPAERREEERAKAPEGSRPADALVPTMESKSVTGFQSTPP